MLLDEAAIPPSKAHQNDAGFDLHIIGVKAGTEDRPAPLYRTGVAVSPPPGWYFDMVVRSSTVKKGYGLANSVGVIDPGYRGEIFAPLVKLRADIEPLEFPNRALQLILRPLPKAQVCIVESLDETDRGTGGFGSTG